MNIGIILLVFTIVLSACSGNKMVPNPNDNVSVQDISAGVNEIETVIDDTNRIVMNNESALPITQELKTIPEEYYGLGIGTSAEGWFDDAVRFWEKHMR